MSTLQFSPLGIFWLSNSLYYSGLEFLARFRWTSECKAITETSRVSWCLASPIRANRAVVGSFAMPSTAKSFPKYQTKSQIGTSTRRMWFEWSRWHLWWLACHGDDGRIVHYVCTFQAGEVLVAWMPRQRCFIIIVLAFIVSVIRLAILEVLQVSSCLVVRLGLRLGSWFREFSCLSFRRFFALIGWCDLCVTGILLSFTACVAPVHFGVTNLANC